MRGHFPYPRIMVIMLVAVLAGGGAWTARDTAVPVAGASSPPVTIGLGADAPDLSPSLDPPTATPTVTLVAKPNFSVIAAKVVYGNANPARATARPSLSRARIHRKVKLIVYVSLSGISGTVPAAFALRVTSGSATVFFRKKAVTLNSSSNGTEHFWVPWAPRKLGIDTLTGTFFLGGTHRHAVSPPFSVGRAQAQTLISISVNTGQAVGGLKLTFYGGQPQITGRVHDALAGVPVVLQANRFPFAGFATVRRAVTGAGGAYTFSAAPVLATRYRVALATNPASTSSTVTVYVEARFYKSTSNCPPAPVCTVHFTEVLHYPAAVAAREGGKLMYFYFGKRNASEGLLPARVDLLQTGRQYRVSSGFSVTFSASFAYGRWKVAWGVCTRDTEPADGLGLPGHHGCGDPSYPQARFAYMG